MRGFFSRGSAPPASVLMIESGPRETGELVLARLRQLGVRCDVLTCYDSAPLAFDPASANLFSVHSPEAVTHRGAFLNRLATYPYDAIVILCPGSGVLAKWKWAIAAKTRTRLAIADEFGEWFFVNIGSLGPLAVLTARRMNLSSIPLLLLQMAKVLMAPFVIAYLTAYAAVVHLRRLLRMRRAHPS